MVRIRSVNLTKGISNWNRCYRNTAHPRARNPKTPRTKKEIGPREARPKTPRTKKEIGLREARPKTPRTKKEIVLREARPKTPRTKKENRAARSAAENGTVGNGVLVKNGYQVIEGSTKLRTCSKDKC